MKFGDFALAVLASTIGGLIIYFFVTRPRIASAGSFSVPVGPSGELDIYGKRFSVA